MAFVCVYFNGVLEDQVELIKELTSIGRSPDNDIQIDNAGVSAHHARIVQEGELLYIEDTNSTNGTSVNGEPISKQQLQYGDIIGVSKHSLKISALAQPPQNAKVSGSDKNVATDAGTVEIDVSQLDLLMEQQRPIKGAYLLINGNNGRTRKHPLTKSSFTIGKDPLSSWVVRGWFLPRSIASIDHRVDGYYLAPSKRSRIRLNGSRVFKDVKLRNGDNLSGHRIAAQFFVERLDKAAERS
jgi:predicted component of type VI protein secretion system